MKHVIAGVVESGEKVKFCAPRGPLWDALSDAEKVVALEALFDFVQSNDTGLIRRAADVGGPVVCIPEQAIVDINLGDTLP